MNRCVLLILLAYGMLLLNSCVSNVNKSGIDSDSICDSIPLTEENVTPVIESVPQIYMKDDFNPTIKITKEIKQSSLKDLFKEHFVSKAIDATLNKQHAEYLRRNSSNGYIDLRETGPVSCVELEYINGKLGKSAPSVYLYEMRLSGKDMSHRKSIEIPMESNLAKAYLLQSFVDFCTNNQELVEIWVNEMDKEMSEENKSSAKKNQQKYL